MKANPSSPKFHQFLAEGNIVCGMRAGIIGWAAIMGLARFMPENRHGHESAPPPGAHAQVQPSLPTP